MQADLLPILDRDVELVAQLLDTIGIFASLSPHFVLPHHKSASGVCMPAYHLTNVYADIKPSVGGVNDNSNSNRNASSIPMATQVGYW